MKQFILIDHLKVQNANAVAGFTWGFPAITNFLGFVHNLGRKLANEEKFQDITLAGCAVIAHEHNVHTYGSHERMFTQSRNPPYLPSHNKAATPPVIEEGKMNMTVSLLIGCEGNIGNRADIFQQWLKNACLLQRLAGGTILDMADVSFFAPQDQRDVRIITRRLLPGFVLIDRSQYLEDHYQELSKANHDIELLDAWLDFSALKQKARPKSNLISKHLQQLLKKDPENQQLIQLVEVWQNHLAIPYDENDIPAEIKIFFEQLEDNTTNKKLLEQWQDYAAPNNKTDADWRYIEKPRSGYLVPIMTGYKAISKVYDNAEVSCTRDSETDVCFVESVHSIGEWKSAHHLKTPEQLQDCLWQYQYEENWYLCKQGIALQDEEAEEETIYY